MRPSGPWNKGYSCWRAFAAVRELAVAARGGGALLGQALAGHRGRLVTALLSSGVMTRPGDADAHSSGVEQPAATVLVGGRW